MEKTQIQNLIKKSMLLVEELYDYLPLCGVRVDFFTEFIELELCTSDIKIEISWNDTVYVSDEYNSLSGKTKERIEKLVEAVIKGDRETMNRVLDEVKKGRIEMKKQGR